MFQTLCLGECIFKTDCSAPHKYEKKKATSEAVFHPSRNARFQNRGGKASFIFYGSRSRSNQSHIETESAAALSVLVCLLILQGVIMTQKKVAFLLIYFLNYLHCHTTIHLCIRCQATPDTFTDSVLSCCCVTENLHFNATLETGAAF